MTTLHLDYQGLSIAVTADSESDLHWLQDFFGPSYKFGVAAADSAARRIALHEDPLWSHRRRCMAEHQASGTIGRVLAHVLDGTDLHLPCLRPADASLLAWDELLECFYLQDCDGLTTVLQPQQSPRLRRPRLALMRSVRELVLHHELRSGSLVLHASGLVRDGRALLFAGPRRAGKTTLLSAGLNLVPGLELLANDRVIVSPQVGGWSSRGMATVVSVRPGVDTVLPGLLQRLHANTLGPEAGPQESRSREFPIHGRLLLSPSQYCKSFGVTQVAEAQLAAIMLPRIDLSAIGLHWRPLYPAAAAVSLAGALFASSHQGSRSELFDSPESGPFPEEAELAERMQRLASDIACFELVIGADAYRPEHLIRLLDDVFDAR